MPLTFHREVQTASFYSPLEDFELVEVDVEVRTDPLVGRQARIVPGGFVMPAEEPDIDSVVRDADGCFFCPGTVTEATPEYPDWVGVDRGRRGEATSFPNLNPYGPYSNVVALTEAHYHPLDELPAEAFADGLALAAEYITTVAGHDPDVAYASVNMNFLPAAGSSIVHPHLQTLIDPQGTTVHAGLAEACRAYHDANGTHYHEDLLTTERDTDRYIGETPGVEWVASYAPRHHRHIQGITTDTGFLEPDAPAIEGLAAGITNVLGSYAAAGLNAYNFALFLGDHHAVLDIIARSVFGEYYWSDSPFFTVLHNEGVVETPPEAYAADARDHF